MLRDLTLLRKLVRELTDPEIQVILQDPKVRQVIQDLSGGDDDAAGSTEPLGDWDDDEWFDDDSEEWWDDDYDFGKDWDGFEDDESGALGIISSVEPTKTVNKRHMTPEQRAAARRGAGFSFADHPALSAVAALVGALAAAYGCATMRRSDEAPKENPCCGGKYKEAQA